LVSSNSSYCWNGIILNTKTHIVPLLDCIVIKCCWFNAFNFRRYIGKISRSCIVLMLFVNFYKMIFQIGGTCIIKELVSMIKTELFHSIFNI
jgi:hypothetical protein